MLIKQLKHSKCNVQQTSVCVIPRSHDEAGSTSWLDERTTSARRASSSSQFHRVNGV